MPQSVPNGPRTPTRSPTPSRQSAPVTGPTSRTVWRSGPASAGALLIEIAASPTPNAVSMLNWPERKDIRAPVSG